MIDHDTGIDADAFAPVTDAVWLVWLATVFARTSLELDRAFRDYSYATDAGIVWC